MPLLPNTPAIPSSELSTWVKCGAVDAIAARRRGVRDNW